MDAEKLTQAAGVSCCNDDGCSFAARRLVNALDLVSTQPDEFERRERTIAPTILLSSGRYFDFLEPRALTLGEVAHALGNLSRFTGHCREFYSVAQHSVLVSYIVPPELALWGLMHDAVEAVVGDMSSPLKRLFPEYKALEKRCEAVILAGFGLHGEVPPEVKRADLVALRTEQRDLMHKDGGLWTSLDGIEPVPAKILPLFPNSSRMLFIKRFEQLAEAA